MRDLYAPSLCANALGTWRLERSIVDRTTHSVIDCRGVATFTRDHLGIAYEETVWYTLSGKNLRATRAYHLTAVGDRIVATFTDGRPFFAVTPDPRGAGRAEHLCGDDRYRLRLSLRDAVAWSTIWDVTGTKALRITTRYRR
jgi:hypothetical protein